MAKRCKGSIVVSMGCPLATYIKEWRRRVPAKRRRRAQGGGQSYSK